MKKEDILKFSSFLGEHVKNLHSLPIPRVHSVVNGKHQLKLGQLDKKHSPWTSTKVSGEWSLFIGMMRRQRQSIISDLEER
jgi:hypothetical protein